MRQRHAPAQPSPLAAYQNQMLAQSAKMRSRLKGSAQVYLNDFSQDKQPGANLDASADEPIDPTALPRSNHDPIDGTFPNGPSPNALPALPALPSAPVTSTPVTSYVTASTQATALPPPGVPAPVFSNPGQTRDLPRAHQPVQTQPSITAVGPPKNRLSPRQPSSNPAWAADPPDKYEDLSQGLKQVNAYFLDDGPGSGSAFSIEQTGATGLMLVKILHPPNFEIGLEARIHLRRSRVYAVRQLMMAMRKNPEFAAWCTVDEVQGWGLVYARSPLARAVVTGQGLVVRPVCAAYAVGQAQAVRQREVMRNFDRVMAPIEGEHPRINSLGEAAALVRMISGPLADGAAL